jgi:octanoyl-[GcvH]:protein N-octanoyltransferase
MRVLRGQVSESTLEHNVGKEMLVAVSRTAEPIVRVWCPPKSVVFGPRDTNEDGYDRARTIAQNNGYRVRERSVGGRAVAYSGTTVAFARAEPTQDGRRSISERYDRTTAQVQEALSSLDVAAERGEPPGAFCPGSQSLSADGKIVGMAQRVREEAALTAGLVVTRDHDELARVLEPIYETFDMEFDPAAVGSVHRAGGRAAPETVTRAIERALGDGAEPTLVDVDRFIND